MTKEYKELLLKDLCSRVCYNPKFTFGNNVYTLDGIVECVNDEGDWVHCLHAKGIEPIEIELCRPYLFPLSSMSIEQERELSQLGISYCEYALHDDIRGLGIMVDEAYIFFEFCYKHHIDFLDLIEKGLAIDATGLNIY